MSQSRTNEIEFTVTQVMQEPEWWSLAGDIGMYRIRALSSSRARFTAEVYTATGAYTDILGRCALYFDGEGSIGGLDELSAIIQAAEGSPDSTPDPDDTSVDK